MLKEGDRAPDFCLRGIDEKGEEREFSLKDFRGEKLILYFYPKDNTPGCTVEACDFRDNLNKLVRMGYRVVGVSPDSVESHRKFREKHSLNFPLLSDPDKKVAEAFGAFGEKKMYGKVTKGIIRSTVLIDEEGRVLSRPSFNVPVRDPIGAGDAFSAGFLHGFWEGGVKRGLEWGSALSALKCGALGDTFRFTEAEVRRLLEEGESGDGS